MWVPAYPLQEKELRLKTEGRRLPPLPGPLLLVRLRLRLRRDKRRGGVLLLFCFPGWPSFLGYPGLLSGHPYGISVWRRARRERLSLATGSENDRKDENDEANDHSQ